MRKYNKNSFLFFFVIIFIICGLAGVSFERLKGRTIDFAAGLMHGNYYSFLDYKQYVDDFSNKELSYHDQMIDINSVKDNLLGTRVIPKDDTTVIKADSGSLTAVKDKISDSDIKKIVENISELKVISDNNGAKFLYCAAPTKELYEKNPENAVNYSKENNLYFFSELKQQQIPYMDFTSSLADNHIAENDIFYFTDHHWKTFSGFVATKSLCEELNKRYSFSYNKQYTNIDQYKVETYPNWFLGSRGKKIGTYFTWHGADDFELITPNFETNLTESQPFKNESRNGNFENTVLYMENMEKDYYKSNTYATYSGGDFRLQIMKNNLNPNGKKIFLIRDSFACVVAPFLALQTSELHICDMRDGEYYVGDKLNAEEYIKKIKPDYVLVLYYDVTSLKKSNGKYDFL